MTSGSEKPLLISIVSVQDWWALTNRSGHMSVTPIAVWGMFQEGDSKVWADGVYANLGIPWSSLPNWVGYYRSVDAPEMGKLLRDWYMPPEDRDFAPSAWFMG